jgi:hypothetical protein
VIWSSRSHVEKVPNAQEVAGVSARHAALSFGRTVGHVAARAFANGLRSARIRKAEHHGV